MSGFSINKIFLSGNLTRDPELRTTPSGASVCHLGLANNTRRKNSSTGEWVDKPNFFNITVWGGMGEWCATNIAKGQRVVVEGRIEWRQWEQDGQKRHDYDVIADSVVPLVTTGQSKPQSDVPADSEGLITAPSGPSDDDDIPF